MTGAEELTARAHVPCTGLEHSAFSKYTACSRS